MSDLQKDYEDLKQQYQLPAFTELDEEFEIKCIEEYDNLLREIRNVVAEPLQLVLDVLDPILHPEASMASMIEASIFNDAEKNELFSLYKKLMYLKRRAITLKIMNDDAADAEFIKEVNSQMREIKRDLHPFLVKLEESWTKDHEVDEKLGYYG